MKIKSLLLLGLMTIGSMNAFADNFKSGGLVYTLTTGTPNTATVDGVRAGFLTASNKSIVIPATVTDGDGKVYNVTGFTTNTWMTTVSATVDFETENVNAAANKPTSLTININNFAAIPTAAQLNIPSLTTLEIKGTSTIGGDITVPDYTGNLTSLATLDLDELAPKSGKSLTIAPITGTLNKLVTVNLPSIDVPANAFEGLTALKTVTGAKNIGKEAFKGATALESITFTGTEIAKKAFAGAAKLATINLSAVTTIGDYAFTGTKITTANLAAATSIGEGAFKGVATITSLTLNSAKAVTIGDNAFDGCAGVTELTIPATVAYAAGAGAAGVFDNMTNLATLSIYNATIPAIFAGDNKIENLTIENATLATIADNAFTSPLIKVIDLSKCPALTTVRTVAPGAFAAGLALTKVKLLGSQVPLAQIDLTGAQNSLKTITVSDVDAAIANDQFNGFTKLATAVLPEGLTTIGNRAFKDCSALTSINIPSTVTVIKLKAFEGSALTAVSIPAGVAVGDNAFANCAALATAEFLDGAGATIIGLNAFEATALTAVNLPAAVTTLGADAFKDCAVLKTFVAANLANIPTAFDGCDKLKAVVLPKTVVTIAANAFKDLAKLATVTFQHDATDAGSAVMTSIGANAFEGTAITSIDLSQTQLKTLDNNEVFKGCTALATITLPAELVSLKGKGLLEGTAVETLDASMVNGKVNNLFGTTSAKPNNSLKVLKLGDATINANAFQYCTKLKTAILGAATINSDAFAYCEKLATVEWHAAGSIASNAFDHCAALTTFNIVIDDPDPTTWGWIAGDAFTGCTPFVTLNASKEYAANYGAAPLNTAWSAEIADLTIKTVQDKANANQFVAKFASPVYFTRFDASEVKLYTVYVDGETAYFQACRTDDGFYNVRPNDHVILKTTEEKEISYEITPFLAGKAAVAFDDIQCLYADGDLADIQAALGMGAGDYLYRLTNTTEMGFGFTAYTGTTIKANQFFVSLTKAPASGRLNTVWLDENGNVEGDATGIETVKENNMNDGAIYNMQGVRVEKAQKGLYIQNGKKFVVK